MRQRLLSWETVSRRTERRGNAIYTLLLWRNGDPAQVGMLVAAFGAAAAATTGCYFFLPPPLWLLVRLLLGEFLVCWMAADHCFSGIARLRESGQLRDWLLTCQSPKGIVQGLARSTTGFLLWAIVGWTCVDVAAPLARELLSDTSGVYYRGIVLRVLQSGTFLLIHAVTASYAACRCTEGAMRRNPGVHTWGLALIITVGFALAALAGPFAVLGLLVGPFTPQSGFEVFLYYASGILTSSVLKAWAGRIVARRAVRLLESQAPLESR